MSVRVLGWTASDQIAEMWHGAPLQPPVAHDSKSAATTGGRFGAQLCQPARPETSSRHGPPACFLHIGWSSNVQQPPSRLVFLGRMVLTADRSLWLHVYPRGLFQHARLCRWVSNCANTDRLSDTKANLPRMCGGCLGAVHSDACASGPRLAAPGATALGVQIADQGKLGKHQLRPWQAVDWPCLICLGSQPRVMMV